MNELDIGLSKKSKIIEIGSVKKKLWLFKVGEISEISEISGFSYVKSMIFLQKLSRFIEFFEMVKKFFELCSLSFDALTIIFGIL